jgi:hypothetical protein
MTLFIACLVIAAFKMPSYLYVVALCIWAAHLGAHSND